MSAPMLGGDLLAVKGTFNLPAATAPLREELTSYDKIIYNNKNRTTALTWLAGFVIFGLCNR